MRSKDFQRILDEYKKLPWYKKLRITLTVEWHTLMCMGVWNYLFLKPEKVRRQDDFYAIDENDEFIVCPDCGDNSDDGSRCIGCQLGQDR